MATAAVTGTVITSLTDENSIRNGGHTIIITLTGDTWVATVGADNAITTALIAGITADGDERFGWNLVVRANMVFGDVVRTSATVVTVTLGTEPTFSISEGETITITIPATALTAAVVIIAEPAFDIIPVSAEEIAYTTRWQMVQMARLMSGVASTTDMSDAELAWIADAVYMGINTRYRWPWLERRADIGVTISQQYSYLPTDFGRVIVLYNQDLDDGIAIPELPPREFFRRYNDDTTNTAANATHYTIYRNTIYFEPTPSATDTDKYELLYYRRPTRFASDEATPDFGDEWIWVIIDGMLVRIYQREEMFEASAAAEFRYENGIQQMYRYFITRGGSPRIWGDGHRRYKFENIPGLIG